MIAVLYWAGAWLPMGALGQNLVVNGGFEAYSTLPNNYAQLCYSQGWTSASGACSLVPGCGHPDYFHLLGGALVKPPGMIFGNAMPHGGSGMIGFTPWYLVGVTNFREYPRFTLSSPMVVGQPYTVSFWTTNGTNPYSGWGCNRIGVAFTMLPITQSCGAPITTVVPQIEISTIVYSSTWQWHTFTFTPTQAFQYFSIGNFHDDASTTAAQMSPTGGMGAYYFLDDVVVQPSGPLPVEWTYFEAMRGEGRSVELTWGVATEQDNDRFDIERSSNGVDFVNIGTLAGAGNSQSLIEYGFLDKSPMPGMDFYRIRQFDIDGSSTTTEVRSVYFEEGAGVITAWPVPSQGEVHLQVGSIGNGRSSEVIILDMLGRVVLVSPPDEGGSLLVTGLPPGSYIARVDAEGGTLGQCRIVVR